MNILQINSEQLSFALKNIQFNVPGLADPQWHRENIETLKNGLKIPSIVARSILSRYLFMLKFIDENRESLVNSGHIQGNARAMAFTPLFLATMSVTTAGPQGFAKHEAFHILNSLSRHNSQ